MLPDSPLHSAFVALQIPAVTSGFSNLTDNKQAGYNGKTLAFRAAGMEKLVPLIKRFIKVSAMYPKASVLSGFDKASLAIQCFLVMWSYKAGRLNCCF